MVRTIRAIALAIVALMALMWLPAAMARQSGGSTPLVCIDPGHGGEDPGAWHNDLMEKDANLEIALRTKPLVEAMGYRVLMTRTTDVYRSLAERTRMANSHKADLFVSIHCNAATRPSAEGFETFFLSRARNDDSRTVEMLENSVIEFDDEHQPGAAGYHDSPLAFLLADMAQSIYLERSSSFAMEVQKSMERRFPGNPSRGVKQAGFYVLRGALMPSVLVELAFISNPFEERLLRSLDFRLAAAEAIVDAILAYTEQQ